MANVKKKSAPLSDAEKLRKKRMHRAVLAVLLLLILSGVIATFLFSAKTLLFTSNARLLVRKVDVRSTGYWKGRNEQLCQKIGLKLPVNLFALDLAKLRADLKTIPSIEEAEVYRILPDTLQLRLHERSPRAVLNYPGSAWVVDEKAVLIPRMECSAAKMRLPVISGIAVTELSKKSESEIKRIRPALVLLAVTAQRFPQLQIYHVQTRGDEQLEFNARYFRQEMLTVTLPATVSRSRISTMLEALQSALVDAKRRGDTRSHYNMLYNGQVIIN